MTLFPGIHKPQQKVHILIYSLKIISITTILHNYSITNPGVVCFRIVRIFFSSNDFLKGTPKKMYSHRIRGSKKSHYLFSFTIPNKNAEPLHEKTIRTIRNASKKIAWISETYTRFWIFLRLLPLSSLSRFEGRTKNSSQRGTPAPNAETAVKSFLSYLFCRPSIFKLKE